MFTVIIHFNFSQNKESIYWGSWIHTFFLHVFRWKSPFYMPQGHNHNFACYNKEAFVIHKGMFESFYNLWQHLCHSIYLLFLVNSIGFILKVKCDNRYLRSYKSMWPMICTMKLLYFLYCSQICVNCAHTWHTKLWYLYYVIVFTWNVKSWLDNVWGKRWNATIVFMCDLW